MPMTDSNHPAPFTMGDRHGGGAGRSFSGPLAMCSLASVRIEAAQALICAVADAAFGLLPFGRPA